MRDKRDKNLSKIKPKVYIDPNTLVNCRYCGTGFNYMLGSCPTCGGDNDQYDDVVREAEEKQRQYEREVHEREMDKIENSNDYAKAVVVFKILGIIMLALNIIVAVPFLISTIMFAIENLG